MRNVHWAKPIFTPKNIILNAILGLGFDDLEW